MSIDQRVGDEKMMQEYLRQSYHLSERSLTEADVDSAVPLIYEAAIDYFNLLFGDREAALSELTRWCKNERSEYSISRAVGLMQIDDECAAIAISLGGKERNECHKANIVALFSNHAFHDRWRRVGYDALRDPLPPVPDDAYYLRIISVRHDWQRRGLGKWLMTIAIDKGLSEGYRQFRVDVRADNMPARRLYESFGFDTTIEASNPLTPCLMLAMCAQF